MARLPTVGGDNGNWGTVLNEFLQVSLNEDGTIKNSYLNVRDYGASPDASGAVNRTAINLAIADAATAGGGVVYIPSGTYAVDNSISIRSNVWLRGDGFNTIIQQASDSSNSIGIVNSDADSGNNNITISHLVLDCNYANRPGSSNVGIRMIASDANACNRIRIHNVYVKNVPQAGMQLMNCKYLTVTDCIVENTVRDGITVWFNSQYVNINNVICKDIRDDCIALNSETAGHVGAQVKNVAITNVNVSQASDSTLGGGVRIAGAEDVSVSNVVIEYAQGWGLVIEGGLISESSLPAKRITISSIEIKTSGTASSACGGIATAVGETEDVSINSPIVRNTYGHGIQLGGRATVTGAVVRGGQNTNTMGIHIEATGCIISGAIIESTPSSGISVAAEKVVINGCQIWECCQQQAGGAYVLIGGNVNRTVVSATILRKVTTGSYGVRIATGASTGVNAKGCVAQGFGGNGFSDGSSGGTNDLTGNLSI